MDILDQKWILRYLRLAKEVASWSKDRSKQIGAVAVNQRGIILSTGYNGFPRGIEDRLSRYSNREEKYKFIVHAEMNCIYNASYNGVSLDNSYLFVYGLPVCSKCMDGVISVGVKGVFWTAKDDEIRGPWLSEYDMTLEKSMETGIPIKRVDFGLIL